jgi:hypothetical protein
MDNSPSWREQPHRQDAKRSKTINRQDAKAPGEASRSTAKAPGKTRRLTAKTPRRQEIQIISAENQTHRTTLIVRRIKNRNDHFHEPAVFTVDLDLFSWRLGVMAVN